MTESDTYFSLAQKMRGARESHENVYALQEKLRAINVAVSGQSWAGPTAKEPPLENVNKGLGALATAIEVFEDLAHRAASRQDAEKSKSEPDENT